MIAEARIEITKDLLTACGIVLLVNEDSDAFKADYEAAQRIIDEGLFEVAPPTADEAEEGLSRPRGVTSSGNSPVSQLSPRLST